MTDSPRNAIARGRAPVVALLAGLLVACAGGPAPAEWQLQSQGAGERAMAAALRGETRIAEVEAARQRLAVARTGEPAWLARAALQQCAVLRASLDETPCTHFDAVRDDAGAAERAYADYLAGRVDAGRLDLLPAWHRAAAQRLLDPRPVGPGDVAILTAMADPLARLVAASVWFRAGQGHPLVLAVASDTASAQGWSRPLLAWLEVQARVAERAGDIPQALALRRRMALVSDTR